MTAYTYRAQNDRGDTTVRLSPPFLEVDTPDGESLRLPLDEVGQVELTVMDAPGGLKLHTLCVYAAGEKKAFPRITNTGFTAANAESESAIIRAGFKIQDEGFRRFASAFHQEVARHAPHAHFTGQEFDMKMLIQALGFTALVAVVTLASAWMMLSLSGSYIVALADLAAGAFAATLIWRRITGARRYAYDPQAIPASLMPAANDRW